MFWRFLPSAAHALSWGDGHEEDAIHTLELFQMYESLKRSIINHIYLNTLLSIHTSFCGHPPMILHPQPSPGRRRTYMIHNRARKIQLTSPEQPVTMATRPEVRRALIPTFEPKNKQMQHTAYGPLNIAFQINREPEPGESDQIVQDVLQAGFASSSWFANEICNLSARIASILTQCGTGATSPGTIHVLSFSVDNDELAEVPEVLNAMAKALGKTDLITMR